MSCSSKKEVSVACGGRLGVKLQPYYLLQPYALPLGAATQLEVMLTSATLSVALIGVISGLFGMNLHNTYEDSYNTFVLVRL